MRATQHEIRTILSHRGVLAVRDHPDLRRAAYHLAARGVLVAVLPGVFTAASQEQIPEIRIRAAALYGRGVVTAHAAARLTFWPSLPVSVIRIATAVDRLPRSGICFERRVIPADWLWRRGGVTVTRPALTAIDLIPDLGGAVTSEALRAGVPMSSLWAAVEAVRHRPGHRQRRRTLHAYRGVPWSEAEQELHALMRAAHLFTADWLCARGWRVLRFTWRQITERPQWVIDTIRRTLRLAEADRSSTQQGRMAAIGR